MVRHAAYAGVDLAARSLDEDPSAARHLLEEMSHELRRALDDTRALAHRIYPPLLEEGGLVAALRSVAASIGVPIRIHVAADIDHLAHVAGVVYLCCREVLEHADAETPITVNVRDDDDGLAFEIIAAADLQVGDVPIRDRVEALGGRLTRSSGADHGTRFVGSLPLSG